MTPVYTKEDCHHFVGYSNLAQFIADNSDMNMDDAMYLLCETILGLDEFYSMHKRKDYENLSEDEFQENDKSYWIGSFFMSHPFMNTVFFIYES